MRWSVLTTLLAPLLSPALAGAKCLDPEAFVAPNDVIPEHAEVLLFIPPGPPPTVVEVRAGEARLSVESTVVARELALTVVAIRFDATGQNQVTITWRSNRDGLATLAVDPRWTPPTRSGVELVDQKVEQSSSRCSFESSTILSTSEAGAAFRVVYAESEEAYSAGRTEC